MGAKIGSTCIMPVEMFAQCIAFKGIATRDRLLFGEAALDGVRKV